MSGWPLSHVRLATVTSQVGLCHMSGWPLSLVRLASVTCQVGLCHMSGWPLSHVSLATVTSQVGHCQKQGPSLAVPDVRSSVVGDQKGTGRGWGKGDCRVSVFMLDKGLAVSWVMEGVVDGGEGGGGGELMRFHTDLRHTSHTEADRERGDIPATQRPTQSGDIPAVL